MPAGGSQVVVQGVQTQTYIGSNRTYGVAKDGNTLGVNGIIDPRTDPRYLFWEIAAQRWHTVLGLPSDSVFVPLDWDGSRYVHPQKSEIQTKMIDISEQMVIVYIDVYAYGAVWNLRYGAEGIQRWAAIDGVNYPLPPEGPPGPGMATAYPGASVSGNQEMRNPGLPFAIFGGSKIAELADIIKVN
jgi:hypothetical protein